MIRSLRWRLAVITMVLLSLVMLLAMCLFFTSTYQGMEDDSMKALHLAGMRYGLHSVHTEDAPEGDKGPDDPAPSDEDGPPELPEGEKPDRDKPDKDPQEGKGPAEDRDETSPIPCFVVGYDHDGQLYAEGPGYYDLTDQAYLEQLVRQAAETGAESGVLVGEKMRFLNLDDICGEAYAFTDISSELHYLCRLLSRYILIGLLTMAGFLIISILTSWWAVRPVDRVMKQQRQFVADASHELKTPLTVILTNAELLDADEYTPEEKKQFTGSVLTMARQMRGLVEELLDLARADNGSGNSQTELFDLSRLVSDAILPFEPVYFEAGRMLESTIDPDIRIQGNQCGLQRVVDILLDNGCKYSLPGSTVRLRLTRCGLKGCLLSVESQGDTMTKQECRDIFKRFYRRDPNRSMNHSYGLGLSIAKTVVRRHKGKIWVKSKNGTNTFYVRLPLGRQHR